jgi:formylglycine-generating enzyme required for sulfatase activity
MRMKGRLPALEAAFRAMSPLQVAIGDSGVRMTFVYIPPGEFMMGSPEDEPERRDDEVQHHVTLTRGFYMQTTPVTQGQWETVMGNNPSHFKEDGPECPVENVSWEDAQAFIKKLNRAAGDEVYRLPTEAEWEYACRAGTTTPFYTGRCLGTDQANYDGNYPLKGCPKGEFRQKTTPVGSFPSNPFGLYDMHGNVWEWCQDWHGPYPSEPVVDPTGPATGSVRVRRGGGWFNVGRVCRSAYRGAFAPAFRYWDGGFRLVRRPGQ